MAAHTPLENYYYFYFCQEHDESLSDQTIMSFPHTIFKVYPSIGKEIYSSIRYPNPQNILQLQRYIELELDIFMTQQL